MEIVSKRVHTIVLHPYTKDVLGNDFEAEVLSDSLSQNGNYNHGGVRTHVIYLLFRILNMFHKVLNPDCVVFATLNYFIINACHYYLLCLASLI